MPKYRLLKQSPLLQLPQDLTVSGAADLYTCLTDQQQGAHLDKNMGGVSLLLWILQECVNSTPSRKVISSDLSWSRCGWTPIWRGLKVISKLFVESSIRQTWRLFLNRTHWWWLSVLTGERVPAGSPQGQTVQCSDEWAASQTLQVSVSRGKITVHDRTIRQRLNKHGLFVPGEKQHGSTGL